MKRFITSIGLTALLLGTAQTAIAGMTQDFKTCEDAIVTTAVETCTVVIDNPKQSVSNRAIAYGNRSWGLIEIADYDKALADADAAIALDDTNANTFNNRGFALFKKGEVEKAIADYDAAIKLDSNLTLAWQNRAWAFHEKREFAKAIINYDEAIRQEPGNADTWNDRGFSYEKSGDLTKALANYNQAIKLNPAFFIAHNNRALIFLSTGDYDKALADYNDMVKRFPNNAEAYNNRGWARYLKGDTDLAIADADIAIELNPQDANYYDTRGAALIKKGKNAEAVNDFDSAINLKADQGSFYRQRAVAKLALADIQGAKADAEKALALQADDADAQKALADIQIAARSVAVATPLEVPVPPATAKLQDKLPTAPVLETQESAAAPVAPLPKPTSPGAVAYRVALIIGNSAYGNGMALANPVNDANAIAASLTRLGFDVILSTNATKAAMTDVMYRFAVKSEGADAAFVFYAGHGMQVDGVNYLMPVDGSLETQADLKHKFVAADDILEDLKTVKGMRMMVLDACRNNPLSRSIKLKLAKVSSRAVDNRAGLADMKAEGVLIAFATQPNEVAADGEAADSPFTLALLKHIETPNIEIDTMFKRVRTTVSEMTDGAQLPQTVNSSTGEFYLKQE